MFRINILFFRFNISFIDPPLDGFGEIFPSVIIFPSEGFISSANISPNLPRPGSINDKYSGSARLVSFEIELTSKEVSRAEPEYMNIQPPPPPPN